MYINNVRYCRTLLYDSIEHFDEAQTIPEVWNKYL
jgi:hypothetical protein